MPSQEKQGWKLEPDPAYAPILVQIVDRFLGGASIGQIVQWLNDSGIPTSADIAKNQVRQAASQRKVDEQPSANT